MTAHAKPETRKPEDLSPEAFRQATALIMRVIENNKEWLKEMAKK
jgi:hypothetical protein